MSETQIVNDIEPCWPSQPVVDHESYVMEVNEKVNYLAEDILQLRGSITDPEDPDHLVYGSYFNRTGIEPCGYKLLLSLPLQAEFVSAEKAGIVLPEKQVSEHQAASVVAQVLQVGRGAYRDKNRFPEGPWVKPGDYVAMSPYNGCRIRSAIDGKDYRLVNEDSIQAVVAHPDLVKRG